MYLSSMGSCHRAPRRGGGGGGITPLYGLCWYARPQGVWFSSGFGLKKGTDFDHVHSRFSLIRHFIYKELFLPCQSLFK